MTATAETPKKKHTFRDVLSALGRPKVASMLALGFGSGLPFLLTGATFGYWLRDEGTTLTAIGFLSWVGLAYTFKVFWAPLVDRSRLPLLGHLGQRRSWVVFAQLLVAVGLIAMAVFGAHGPGGLATIGAFALLVAFASATQDIAVDAWRIESAPDSEEQSLVTSAFQLGYRAALLVTDALILIFAQNFGWEISYVLMAVLMGVGLFAALRTPEPTRTEPTNRAAQAAVGAAPPMRRTMIAAGMFAVAAAYAWWFSNRADALAEGGDIARASQFGAAFAVVALICAIGCLAKLTRFVWILGAAAVLAVVVVAFYGAATGNDIIGGAPMFWPTVLTLVAAAMVSPPRIFDAMIGPLIEFFRVHGPWALLMLAMISVYRLPEFIIGPVAGPFYHDLGLEKDVVGGVRATVGLVASILGIAAGGICAVRLGFKTTLILGAVLQGIGVAAYAVVATFGAEDLRIFAGAMASDNFCYAFAGVALVAYMSSLTSLGYTATQYALLSSVYTLFGKFLKGFSGAVVDGLDQTHTLMQSYAIFYIGAGLIALPALILCIVLARRHAPEPGQPAPA
jgi:MFS family permease